MEGNLRAASPESDKTQCLSPSLPSPLRNCTNSIFGPDSTSEDTTASEDEFTFVAEGKAKRKHDQTIPRKEKTIGCEEAGRNVDEEGKQTVLCAYCSNAMNGVWFGNGKFCSTACKKKMADTKKAHLPPWQTDNKWVGKRVTVVCPVPGKTSTRAASISATGRITGWVSAEANDG